MTIFPIIMAGGPGARLWPESRAACPKPFLPLLSDSRSFIRATLDRLGDLAPPDARFVVVGKPYAKLVAEQAPELPKERVLLEPVGRDTAPCVAWAALEALRVDEDAALLVLPSDHLIKPDEPFRATIRSAVELLAEEPDALITLGVEPTFPSTVYGYIERGEPLPGERGYRVARFCEKPDAVKAAEFVATPFSGTRAYSSGRRVFLDLLQRFEPEFIPTLQIMRERIDAAASRKGSTTTLNSSAHFRTLKNLARLRGSRTRGKSLCSSGVRVLLERSGFLSGVGRARPRGIDPSKRRS